MPGTQLATPSGRAATIADTRPLVYCMVEVSPVTLSVTWVALNTTVSVLVAAAAMPTKVVSSPSSSVSFTVGRLPVFVTAMVTPAVLVALSNGV